jgi:hypothetical protein
MSAPVGAPAGPRTASAAAFSPLDWALLSGVALAWGASFMFIELGLDHFGPGQTGR